MDEIIELWKKLNIDRCVMNFSCGGDSMNDTDFFLYDKNNNEVEKPILTDYFENDVYEHVEFYVNSDGHYHGEVGTVEIRLNDDGDDFEYYKNSTSEFAEEFTGIAELKLTADEFNFINKYVRTILGSGDTQRVVFKHDCILNDEEVELQERLIEKVNDIAIEYNVPDSDGECSEWYRFTTELNDLDEFQMADVPFAKLGIEGNTLKFAVTKTYYVFRPSEN